MLVGYQDVSRHGLGKRAKAYASRQRCAEGSSSKFQHDRLAALGVVPLVVA